MELFNRNTYEVREAKEAEDCIRAERIRRVLAEHAILRNPPSRGKVTLSYKGAEAPSGMGIAAKVRKRMEEEGR
jgi:hypothetical protein